MHNPLKYDESLKASIDRLEKVKQSLADGDIRRNIIDKELYEGYYDVFDKPEYRILTSYLLADYMVTETGSFHYHENVPALPFNWKEDIRNAEHIIFKTELPQPLTELSSTYLSFLENHFNRDPYVRNRMLESYNEMYQGHIVFYRFYEHIPYESIIEMIDRFCMEFSYKACE